MIKAIQNWLDVRKQYKLEKKAIEMRDDAKKIISGIMIELVKYDIHFYYIPECDLTTWRFGLIYGGQELDLNLFVYCDKIQVKRGVNNIATYETSSWWQKMKHKRNLKKFIYTEDAVKAISNMIIMGEAL